MCYRRAGSCVECRVCRAAHSNLNRNDGGLLRFAGMHPDVANGRSNRSGWFDRSLASSGQAVGAESSAKAGERRGPDAGRVCEDFSTTGKLSTQRRNPFLALGLAPDRAHLLGRTPGGAGTSRVAVRRSLRWGSRLGGLFDEQTIRTTHSAGLGCERGRDEATQPALTAGSVGSHSIGSRAAHDSGNQRNDWMDKSHGQDAGHARPAQTAERCTQTHGSRLK